MLKHFLSSNPKDIFSQQQIKRLLESASILCLSDNSNHQKIAFKITVFLLNSFKNEYKAIPYAAEIILTRLGDLPTIEHMFNEKDGQDSFSYFHEAENSVFAFLDFPEIYAKKILNQFEIFQNRKLTLTNFQSQILRSLLKGQNISFSAPTSAGKSFIVHNYIVYNLLNKAQHTVVYLVPTKSLVTEVQRGILDIVRKSTTDTSEIAVVNSAERLNTDLFKNVGKRVLVLTQERLQFVLSRNERFGIDLLVIDEAQKVKEDERGVVLEDVIDEVIQQNPDLQIVFISPHIGNPNKFGQVFQLARKVTPIYTPKTPVGQNVFYITLRKDEALISILSEEFNSELVSLETFPIKGNVPTAQFRIKSWVVNNILKEKGHTLVYCNRPTECIQIANEITQDRKEDDDISNELREAIDFVRTHVHEEYHLVDHLKARVGYHYGRMPQFIRQVVRELFDKREILFLCCTSTLLEGVNLPAKNIILYKPKTGMQTPMDKFSIKNLAGRAGRLGKDYYGNIYCIDINDWESGSNAFDDELEQLKTSVEKTITLDIDKLIAHLKQYSKPAEGTKNIAAVATSLIVKQIENPGGDFLQRLKKKYSNISDANLDVVKTLLIQISDDVSKLREIIMKNPSIDPRLQFELYNYLRKDGNLVLPPEPDFENFYDDLLKIFNIIQEVLFKDNSAAYTRYAFVANEWISQKPYTRIITNRLNYLKREKEDILDKKLINREIDDIDDIIENTLKYEYTRALRCYCDIIQYIMTRRSGLAPYSMRLPDFLETGAYDNRVFLLLGIGLTRNNAISISREMISTIETTREAMTWLKDNKEMIKSKLHPIMYRELEYIFESS